MIETTQTTAAADARWYAVQARPKQETRAAMNLLSGGVTTFLPLVRQPAVRRSPAPPAPAPLFPRYLFVRCNIEASAQKIRYTRGVAKVLGTGDGPTIIDDEIIESIRLRIGKDGFVRLVDTFDAGDHLEITAGPFKGLVGIFHAATSADERVVLLLNTVNSQMRVLVDSAAVRRVSP